MRTALIAFALIPALTLAPIASGLLPAPATSTDATAVHPGDAMSSSVGSCTVSFVFGGVGALAGNVYMSTAAHCVSGVGESVTVGGTASFATAAYVGDESETKDDFAFLLVDSQHAHRVEASVRGHAGTPTGVTTPAQTGFGDVVLLSGHGLGYSLLAVTRESRVGVLYDHDADTYIMESPLIFGDSGGPLVHAGTGGALGIVSAIVAGCCQGPGVYNEGPTVQRMLSQSAANGFTVELRSP